MKKLMMVFLLVSSQVAFAQEATTTPPPTPAPTESQDISGSIENIDELSLEDLLNMKISVASKTEKSTRQSPGIVTVLTKEELKKMGARDLIDALNFVPGFQFAHDVQGVVGLGVRGNWANEGKFSLLVDGLEMNEILYSSAQFGNHYPIDHIKRIEIIRGPGSAIYGGYAELAVIHVITENGADLNGGKVVATYGQMKEDYGRRNLSVQYGTKKGDWDVSVAGMVGQARRGDGSYTGYVANDTPPPNYLSEKYDYSEGKSNNLNPGWLNVGINNGKLDFRFIYDNYRMTTRSMYGYSGLAAAGLPGVPHTFESMYSSLKYDFKTESGWTITPYLQFRSQNPWKQTDPQALAITGLAFDVNAQRAKIGVSGLWEASEMYTLLIGAENYRDTAKIKTYTDGVTPFNFTMSGKDDIDFDGYAAYLQNSLTFGTVELTLGARWEQIKTPTGRNVSNTVPRLAITHATSNWHIKGLASQAYRVPSIFNFETDFATNGASLIKPEKTTTFEVESGFAVTSKSYLTLNVFSTKIEDPIVYASIAGTDNYFNFPKVSTNGAELEYKVKYAKGFTNVNYSFYQRGTNEVPLYAVPDSKALLGFPQHKATLLSSYKTGLGNLTANPSIVYMGSAYSYAYDEVSDAEVLNKLNDTFLLNLYLTYPDLFTPGLEFGLGVFNITDEDQRYIQPYASGLGSVPGPSREILARLTYSLAF